MVFLIRQEMNSIVKTAAQGDMPVVTSHFAALSNAVKQAKAISISMMA